MYQLIIMFHFLGHGVFTTRNYDKGEFLLEYVGENISPHEAAKRNVQSYTYFFKFGGNLCW